MIAPGAPSYGSQGGLGSPGGPGTLLDLGEGTKREGEEEGGSGGYVHCT